MTSIQLYELREVPDSSIILNILPFDEEESAVYADSESSFMKCEVMLGDWSESENESNRDARILFLLLSFILLNIIFSLFCEDVSE